MLKNEATIVERLSIHIEFEKYVLFYTTRVRLSFFNFFMYIRLKLEKDKN